MAQIKGQALLFKQIAPALYIAARSTTIHSNELMGEFQALCDRDEQRIKHLHAKAKCQNRRQATDFKDGFQKLGKTHHALKNRFVTSAP